MTNLRTAAQQALEALEAQHKDRTAYSEAKRRANATCGEFKNNPISALIESGYMHSLMGKQTVETITALKAALAEPVQEPDIAQQVVSEQAEDEGLWFVAVTASEAYLQQALRRLHAAVEGEDDQDAD